MSVSILIVDDNEEKVQRILECVSACGGAAIRANVVGTATEARRELSSARYDLLILDIALPSRPGAAVDRRGGITLLEELVERDTFNLPEMVLGLTGYDDLYREFSESFRSRLWTLDTYDVGSTGWMERLRAKVLYLLERSNRLAQKKFGVDVCVIAALHAPELEALRSNGWSWKPPVALDEVNFCYEAEFISGELPRSAIAAAAPRMGNVSSALLGMKMISEFRPRLLVMIGIAAGVRGRCDIGDVLIADPCWEWQSGKIERGAFAFAPDQIDVPVEVSQRCVQLGDDREFWFRMHDKFRGTKPSNIPSLRIGPVASGSTVLADGSRIEEIKEQHRKLIGIEMEIYGVYASARDSSVPRPRTFSMKSVCDFGDHAKGDDFQTYSSYTSAQAMTAFAERYVKDF